MSMLCWTLLTFAFISTVLQLQIDAETAVEEFISVQELYFSFVPPKRFSARDNVHLTINYNDPKQNRRVVDTYKTSPFMKRKLSGKVFHTGGRFVVRIKAKLYRWNHCCGSCCTKKCWESTGNFESIGKVKIDPQNGYGKASVAVRGGRFDMKTTKGKLEDDDWHERFLFENGTAVHFNHPNETERFLREHIEPPILISDEKRRLLNKIC